MKHILLVEDDPVTQKIVRQALPENTELTVRQTLQEGIAALDEIPNLALIIIDRSLPDGDGLELCARVRAEERLNQVAVIFLSGKTSESDKVTGLYAGGDDYLAKPISALELRARIAARLRRAPKKLFAGGIEVDLENHNVTIGGTQVDLTRTEFRILATLLAAPERVFPRELLLDKVWGPGKYVSDRVVDTHVCHLRKKISGSDVLLDALRGEGYRLRVSSATASVAKGDAA